MYYLSELVVGFAIPLLAYAIASAWQSYMSYRARVLSASLRAYAEGKLTEILSEPNANEMVRSFATHLIEVLNDSDEMRARGEKFVSLQNEPEPEGEDGATLEFKQKIGVNYVDRFERLFPILSTACFLLHPRLGRMYYRTLIRTAAASAAERAIRNAELSAMERRAIYKTPPVLLIQSASRREEREWECTA
jgi:hypothetical protein